MGALFSNFEIGFVSVLVVDTVNSTEHVATSEPDETQAFLGEIFALVEVSVSDCAGHLVSFTGDGGVAVFGWPDSLENHAQHACEAATRIVDARRAKIVGPDGRPAQFRVGVHSGVVGLQHVTIEGVPRLNTVGAVVHLAAALEKNAPPDRVAISETTLELCAKPPGVVEYEDVPAMSKIGLRSFLLTRDESRSATKTMASRQEMPLIGRDSELASLQQLVAGSDRSFACAAVLGEPGIGKTRLLTELLKRTEATGRRALRFDASIGTEFRPYAVFRAFLKQSLPNGVAGSALDDILDKAGLNRDERAFIRAVLDGEMVHRSIAYLPSQMQIVRTAIRAVLELNRRHPLLIVVDDIQLIDPESLSCLSELSLNYAPPGTALLIAARTEAADRVEPLASLTLRLEPLREGEMVRLAHSSPNAKFLTAPVLQNAVRKADGVPFVLEQILLSAGRNAQDGGAAIPSRVHSLILSRLNALSPETKELAQGLSILGEDVDFDFLCRFAGLKPHALSPRIAELDRLGFVQRPDPTVIQFRHDILAEACSTTIPKQQRRALHLSAIETMLCTGQDQRHDMLAYHHEAAGLYDEALDHLWKAGIQARASSAMGSLARIVTQAFGCIEQSGTSADSRYVRFILMASASLLQIGEIAFVKQHLERALQLANEHGSQRELCGALSQIAALRWFEGEYSDGLICAQRAVASVEDMGSLPHLFAAKMVYSMLLWITADVRPAIELHQELCEILTGDLTGSRLGAAALPSVMTRTFMAWAQADIGLYEESRETSEQGLEIARTFGDPFAQALALSSLGNAQIALGRYDAACETLEEAYALCRRNGYHTSLPTVLGNLAVALSRTDRTQEALTICRNWFDQGAEDRTGHFELLFATKGYAEALARSGKIDHSLNMTAAGWQLAARVNSPALKLRMLETRSLVLEIEGRQPDLAAADHAEIRRLCSRHGLVSWS